jgi:hypothetical protein
MVDSMVLITATGDHDRPEWLIRINGIRNRFWSLSDFPYLLIYRPRSDALARALRAHGAGSPERVVRVVV